jgi:chromosome segregation ATPase
MAKDLHLTKEQDKVLSEDLEKAYEHIGESENIMKQKDDEIAFLSNKLSEFENTVNKYSENLHGARNEYNRTIDDYKKLISRKNDDLRHMKDHYDRVVRDVYKKLIFKA